VWIQRADRMHAGGMQRAFTAGLLFASYSHAIISYQPPKREHNGGCIKGTMVLYFFGRRALRPLYLFVGWSQAPLPLEVGALHA
jgi:hypothetical protein